MNRSILSNNAVINKMERLSESGYLSTDSDIVDEELEIALYAQVHFEENNSYLENSTSRDDSCFEFQVDGNDKSGFLANETTSSMILDQTIEEKYDTVKADVCSISGKRIDVCNSAADIRTDADIRTESKPLDNRDSKRPQKKEQFKSSFNEPILIDSNGDSNSDTESLYALIASDSEVSSLQLNITGNKVVGCDDDKSESDWKIIHADKGTRIGGKARYYKPITCHNCKEAGHMSKFCPKPKKQICGFCSENGHVMRNCPNSLCYNCDESGHDAKACPKPRRQQYKVCYRCDYTGHQQARCPDHWRQYHLTTKLGKLRKGRKIKRKSVIYCYNCTGNDHFGHECDEERMSRHVCLNTPFISRYSIDDKCMNRDEAFTEEADIPTSKKAKLTKKPKLSSYIPASFRNDKPFNSSKALTGRANFDKLQVGLSNKMKKKKQGGNMHKVKETEGEVVDLTSGSQKKKKKKKKKKNETFSNKAEFHQNAKSKNKDLIPNVSKLRDISVTVYNSHKRFK